MMNTNDCLLKMILSLMRNIYCRVLHLNPSSQAILKLQPLIFLISFPYIIRDVRYSKYLAKESEIIKQEKHLRVHKNFFFG